MLNTWLDQALRHAQPVLMVVSCLCLCLGSCFPSSEPLNRIAATQSNTPEMMPLGGETVHTTAVTTVINKVFSLNSDPHFRNMDTVIQGRLDSVGQQLYSTTSATVMVNSTREGSNSLPPSSSPSNKDRHRQRPDFKKRTNKSTTREQSHLVHKSKSRSFKNKKRLPSERRGKTRHQPGLEPRAGKRNRRMQRLECGIPKSRMGRVRQLENSLAFALAVYPDGTVNGTKDRSDVHTLLTFVAFRWGSIRIFGEAAGRFVCMNNQTGEVYSAEYATKECIFNEKSQPRNLMITYSLVHSKKKSIEWYLGISKKGVVKNGRRVRSVLKIAHFLRVIPPAEIVC